MRSCDRDHMYCKPQNIHYLTLHRNSLPTNPCLERTQDGSTHWFHFLLQGPPWGGEGQRGTTSSLLPNPRDEVWSSLLSLWNFISLFLPSAESQGTPLFPTKPYTWPPTQFLLVHCVTTAHPRKHIYAFFQLGGFPNVKNMNAELPPPKPHLTGTSTCYNNCFRNRHIFS